jgi:hypothetical protein
MGWQLANGTGRVDGRRSDGGYGEAVLVIHSVSPVPPRRPPSSFMPYARPFPWGSLAAPATRNVLR